MNMNIQQLFNKKKELEQVINKMLDTNVNEGNIERMTSIFDKIGLKCNELFNEAKEIKININELPEVKKFFNEFKGDAVNLQSFRGYLVNIIENNITKERNKTLELTTNN